MNTKRTGFTIIELMIAMGIFVIITSLVTINLLNAQHIASIDSTVTTLIADLKQQQVKAMTGDTEGRGITDQYGI
jgi:prepilin-type N-terminal cleavage/methylation domain-containing protein